MPAPITATRFCGIVPPLLRFRPIVSVDEAAIALQHGLLLLNGTLSFLNFGVRSLVMGLRSGGEGGDHSAHFVIVIPHPRCWVGRGRR